MSIQRRASWGKRTNQLVDGLASRVDLQTAEVAQRVAGVLAFAVRLLRWPSLALWVLPMPFELATAVLVLRLHGPARVVGVLVVLATVLVTVVFGVRRWRILRAVAEPHALGTELGIAVSLSDRVDETRGALAEIVGGGGARMFTRLRGLWRGLSMTGRWIEEVGDLPRARYFVPPKVGTTVTLTIAAAIVVPASVVCAVLSVIATVAQ